jgi:hypothetical protein
VQERTRDRRSRQTFWIDDRIVDQFGPVMGQYPVGAAALAVYAVLARRADRDGESWPRMRAIAECAGVSPRTAQRAIALLEVLGLVEVATCYEQGSHRQTSNLYTLLTPPATPPAIDPDPAAWPEPRRRSLVVRGSNRAQVVADAREQERLEVVGEAETPRQPDTPSPVRLTPPPRHGDTPSPVTVAGQEGNTDEGTPVKEGAPPLFVIAEVGLSNRQVWAAALVELEALVGRGEVETWLRPAALVGRDGETLLLAAASRVGRERIATRLLPAVRAGLAAVLGAPVPVVVVESGIGNELSA